MTIRWAIYDSRQNKFVTTKVFYTSKAASEEADTYNSNSVYVICIDVPKKAEAKKVKGGINLPLKRKEPNG